MRIVLTGGGTGGHLFPLVAVAKKLKEKRGSDIEFLYLGPSQKMEKEIMKRENIKAKRIISGKMRRYFSPFNFTDMLKIPVGFIQSLWELFVFMPDAVFSKGGYAAIPVVLAAWVYRIPILSHESDAIPGIANKILGKFSNWIAVSYPSAQKYFLKSKVVITGNPIREEIVQGSSEAARKRFNLIESKPVILVMGGSQGAFRINQDIVKILPELLRQAQIIHQTGEKTFEETKRLAAEAGIKAGRRGYHPIPFMQIDDLKNALAVADLIISRAGANSIANIAAARKPAILIPLPTAANNHQQMNAYEIARIGGALVLEESNLGENMLLGKIEKILGDENLRRNMARKISAFYHPEAADKIAEGLIELAGK